MVFFSVFPVRILMSCRRVLASFFPPPPPLAPWAPQAHLPPPFPLRLAQLARRAPALRLQSFAWTVPQHGRRQRRAAIGSDKHRSGGTIVPPFNVRPTLPSAEVPSLGTCRSSYRAGGVTLFYVNNKRSCRITVFIFIICWPGSSTLAIVYACCCYV